MAESKQSGFHEGVTMPMKPVGVGSSIHTDATVVMPKTAAGGARLQTAVQSSSFKVKAASPAEAEYGGRYAMVRAIAKGGMGEIHLAKDGELEREVAVKVSTVSEGAVDPRFTKEARVLANLAHPNIVPIYNLGADSAGRPFYSMKLVKGRTLQSVLNAVREGEDAAVAEFTRARLLTVFRKVCDAMAFAHSKGVLHRDLKPENVMVGEYGEVLVMDWGLAKVIGVEEEVQVGVTTRTVSGGLSGDFGMTMEGEVMGTPQYMSPEQAEGVVAGLDERSDVYALGAILYAVLTYKPPIDGRTLDEVLGNVKRGSLSSMATATRMTKGIGGRPEPMPVEVPEALRAVVMKAMAREKDGRYRNVGDLVADLDAYVGGFATSAEGAGVLRRLRLWVGRNRVLAGAAAVLLVFGAKVVVDGQRANRAIKKLWSSAPVFAARAEELLKKGEFQDAMEAIDSALSLRPESSAFHRIRGNVLQVQMRFSEAVDEYRLAKEDDIATKNLNETLDLVAIVDSVGREKATSRLVEVLNAQGRNYEAVAVSSRLEKYWETQGKQVKDLTTLPYLLNSLSEGLLKVPETDILLGKTQMTVGLWKRYLRAEGLSDWQQPEAQKFLQDDSHPVVNVSWDEVETFCQWLSRVTGETWRLPTNKEWDKAIGPLTYPWGNHFPPGPEDGNYNIDSVTGRGNGVGGTDRFIGTSPVGTFKPNVLGFYDLGGNVSEFMSDYESRNDRVNQRVYRGCNWHGDNNRTKTADKPWVFKTERRAFIGFRVAKEVRRQ